MEPCIGGKRYHKGQSMSSSYIIKPTGGIDFLKSIISIDKSSLYFITCNRLANFFIK
jgi:hypothetical protein